MSLFRRPDQSRLPALFKRVLLVVAGLILGGFAPARAAEPAGLASRAYLWQRAWTPQLSRSLGEIAPAFAGLDILAAEISWPAQGPVVTTIRPDWAALRLSARPVGIVVRVGPRAGPWEPDSPATLTVVRTCLAGLAAARAAGIEPAELQLDFDAATAGLRDYRSLLETVRREVRPPRLVFTALPDWLRSADFAALAGTADCYVLQVHSLEKPTTIAAAFTLCDPVRAAAWIERAARLGRPFRIALPSYGYRLVFDRGGNFTALEAEGPTRNWPDGYQTRLALAEPRSLAIFVQQLLAKPPAACEGIVWFRFPNPDDELAWRWPTLRAVMQGLVPVAHLELRAGPTPAENFDLSVVNTGSAAAEPAAFRLTWAAARLVAADALAGWQLERPDGSTLIVRPPPLGSNGLLQPGDSIQVGWLRLDRPAALTPSSEP